MKILRIGEEGFERYLSRVEGRMVQEGLHSKGSSSHLGGCEETGRSGSRPLYQVFDGLRIPIHDSR